MSGFKLNMKNFGFGMLLVIIGLCSGCGGSQKQEPAASHSSGHHHEPPHGGTAVNLGNEDCHLEFLLEAAAGKLTCYVLGPHMSGFLRLPVESFEVTAKADGKEQLLVFKAVANSATGEKAGDTSQFEAQADWLKTTKNFDAVLKQLTIRGNSYMVVPFNFPKGN
jgi:hypothetical protein